MSGRTGLRHRVVVTLSAVALVLWFVFAGLFIQYAATRPRTPRPEIGRIYQINNHGTIAYLDHSERTRLTFTACSAGTLFVIAFILSRPPKKAN